MALFPPKDIPKRRARRPRYGLYICLVALCAIALVVCYSLFVQRADDAKPDSTPRGKRQIKAIKQSSTGVSTNNAADKSVGSSGASTSERKLWLGKEVKEHRVVTNSTLIVETFVTTDGKTHKYYHDEREKALPTAADQMLALMTASDDGFGAPPLPHIPNFEAAFGKALKTDIIINESDSPEVKAIKERVIAARKELLDLMAQGVNANDVVEEYRRTQEDNATIRFDAAKGVRELLDAGDIDAAKELCAKYNEVLKSANIMPIEIPEEYLNKENEK